MSRSAKILVVILILLIDFLASLYLFVYQPEWLFQQFIKTGVTSIIPTVNKKNEQDDIVKSVNSLPSELKLQKKYETLTYQGVSYVKSYAQVMKINIPLTQYELLLDSGQKVTINIDDGAFLGKATYGYNKDGAIVQIEYLPITKDKLRELTAGEKVAIRFEEQDLKSPIINPEEFILLE